MRLILIGTLQEIILVMSVTHQESLLTRRGIIIVLLMVYSPMQMFNSIIDEYRSQINSIGAVLLVSSIASNTKKFADSVFLGCHLDAYLSLLLEKTVTKKVGFGYKFYRREITLI
jgi:hypothetical protein